MIPPFCSINIYSILLYNQRFAVFAYERINTSFKLLFGRKKNQCETQPFHDQKLVIFDICLIYTVLCNDRAL